MSKKWTDRRKRGRKRKRPHNTEIYSCGQNHFYGDGCLDVRVFKKRKLETKEKYNLNNINTLTDLIKLCDFYTDMTMDDHVYDYYHKRINFKNLTDLKPALQKLDTMIGLDDIKSNIVMRVKFYLNGISDNETDLLHTVIYGPPGCGKSTLAEIIGEIYTKLGYLTSGHVITAKATDLIARHTGQTAHLTEKTLDSAYGGVLLIDEVYSLGSGVDNHDAYSKQCADMINRYLSEQKKNFICIIIGYKDDVDRCFFSLNKGLERRFPIRYTISEYTPEHLKAIYLLKLHDIKYTLNTDNVLHAAFFEKNKKYFPYFGGDIEIFVRCCKDVHGNRVFLKNPNKKFKITKKDIENGFKLYLKERGLDTQETQLSYYL